MERMEANERLNALFAEVDALLPSCDPEHVRAHAYRLLRQVSAVERGTDAELVGTDDERIVRRARQIMEAHLGTRLTVAQVAAACRVSPAALKRAFRAVHGVAPAAWFRAYRIDQAQRLLLETDLGIAQVAASVGYANPSKFSEAFREQTGQTPVAWRDAHQ